MKTYELFIGANNDTKEVEIDKITKILDNYFTDGYTVKDCLGRWNGENEKSVSVTIMADASTLRIVLRELVTELKQEAVAFHTVAQLQFYS
jgi:hypothetical protein